MRFGLGNLKTKLSENFEAYFETNQTVKLFKPNCFRFVPLLLSRHHCHHHHLLFSFLVMKFDLPF